MAVGFFESILVPFSLSFHRGTAKPVLPYSVICGTWYIPTSLAQDEWRPVYNLTQETLLVEWQSMHLQYSHYHPCGP